MINSLFVMTLYDKAVKNDLVSIPVESRRRESLDSEWYPSKSAVDCGAHGY